MIQYFFLFFLAFTGHLGPLPYQLLSSTYAYLELGLLRYLLPAQCIFSNSFFPPPFPRSFCFQFPICDQTNRVFGSICMPKSSQFSALKDSNNFFFHHIVLLFPCLFLTQNPLSISFWSKYPPSFKCSQSIFIHLCCCPYATGVQC